MAENLNLPNIPISPMFIGDSEDKIMTIEWQEFFRVLFNRVGGTTAPSIIETDTSTLAELYKTDKSYTKRIDELELLVKSLLTPKSYDKRIDDLKLEVIANPSIPSNIKPPGVSTDNAVVRWDGTTGDKIQNSLYVTISDAGNMSLEGPFSKQPRISLDNYHDDVHSAQINFWKLPDTLSDDDQLGYIGGFCIRSGQPMGYMDFRAADVSADHVGGEINLGVQIDDEGSYMIRCIGYNGAVGEGEINFNDSAKDVDFIIKKLTAGSIFVYDAGNDTISIGDGGTTNFLQIIADGSISFNGTARINWAKITAASITQGAGGHSGTTGDTSGLVGDLTVAFDGNYYHIDEVAAGFDVIIHFTSVTAFNWVQCICNYHGTVSHAVMVQVYNWITTTYDSYRIVPCALDEFGAGINTQGDSGFFIPDDTNYIGTGGDAGKVNIRILHSSSGNAAHDFDVDCVALYQ